MSRLPKTTFKQRLITVSLKWLIRRLKVLPRHKRKRIVGTIGKCLLHLAKKTQNRAIANISRAMPALSQSAAKKLAFDAYANCAFGVAEAFWLEQLTPEIYCDEQTLQILQSGQGACIATMHLGCYEAVPLAIRSLAQQSVTITNVPTFIEDGLSFYANAGITAINKKSENAFIELIKHAKNNAYISLHCDLYANETAVTFFGQATKAPAGVALIAAMSKRPVLLGYSVYNDVGKIQVFFETIVSKHDLDSAQVTPPEQVMANIYQHFERIIKQYPEQWYWSYKRWRK